MKLFASFIVCLLMTLSINAQSRWTLGAFGGVGKSFNTEFTQYTYDQKTVLPDYCYGLTFNVKLGTVSRLRFETSVDRTALRRNWTTTAGSTTSEPKTSTINFYYWNVGLRYDHKLFTVNKLDFYLSPGFKAMFSMGDYEKTEFTKSTDKSTHYMGVDYRKSFPTASMQALIKYNFTPHWGLTIAPEYNYYFKKFYYKCDGVVSRLMCNVGVEWNF